MSNSYENTSVLHNHFSHLLLSTQFLFFLCESIHMATNMFILFLCNVSLKEAGAYNKVLGQKNSRRIPALQKISK